MSQSTAEQRINWRTFECEVNRLKRIAFGPDEIVVAPATADAWNALACVMAAHRYEIRPADTSSYNCRTITGGEGPSLHAYGIALDVNANTNPYRKTPNQPKVRFSNKATQAERGRDVNANIADTDMTPEMIADVAAIKTTKGVQVFEWGGDWKTVKDSMHFEIDVTPDELAAGIDWASVKGANGVAPGNVAWTHPDSPVLPAVQAFAGELGVFEKCMPVIEKWEGNFVNDPDDPGGATNMGITHGTLSRWRQQQVSVDDVRNLTRDEARQIFKALYWDKIKGGSLPLPAAQMCLDSAVLTGVGRSAEGLQEALNRQNATIAVDGVIGPNTISASLRADQKRLVSDIADIAEQYLRGRPGFPKYGKGWLNRLTEVRAVAAAMANAPQQTQPAEGGSTMATTPANDLVSVLQQALALIDTIQKQKAAQAGQTVPPATPAPTPTGTTPVAAPAGPTTPADAVKKLLDVINALTGQPPAAGTAPPNQVNNALGEGIGKLLDGRKTAIGIIGSLVTSLLSAAAPAAEAAAATPTSPLGAIGSLLVSLTPAAGLSGFALPVFLAMTAWGVLGKMEKWSGNAAPTPPK